MKKIAILQSNYIPWKGYFDLIAAVDECILFDDMQYTRRDWRNRNRIKTPAGPLWLSVPVRVKGRYHQKIRDTEIDGRDWAAQHWRGLLQNYRRAPHFSEVAAWLEPLYLNMAHTHLSALNRTFIEAVCAYLDIPTRLTNSWDYVLKEGRTERLVDLCLQAGGDEYLSGPAARDYIEPAAFAARGVRLAWFDYQGYPSYPQLWGDFVHEVSILDLLFNCGRRAPAYMKFAGAGQRSG